MMENKLICENCASPMREMNQCEHTLIVCDSCRTILEPCPMCDEMLRLENICGDDMALCDACEYPVHGPWDNDTRDPNIRETIKLACAECNDLLSLENPRLCRGTGMV